LAVTADPADISVTAKVSAYYRKFSDIAFAAEVATLIGADDAFAEIVRNYPGGAARSEVTRVVGSEDRWVVTPGNTALMVAGSGDFWWSEWRVTYPDGATYLCVDLMELRDGRIWRETVYWASPFEAPTWRSPWVERGPV